MNMIWNKKKKELYVKSKKKIDKMSNQGKEEIYKGRVGSEIPLTTLDKS